jgi:hypothetical protein
MMLSERRRLIDWETVRALLDIAVGRFEEIRLTGQPGRAGGL